MRGLLVFNQLCDLVYLNCCSGFVKHVNTIAEKQGLVQPGSAHSSSQHLKGKRPLDPNVVIQIFLPLVTSHRLMKDQFGNPYTSVQGQDGTNTVFSPYLGYLFIRVGNDEVAFLQRSLSVSISLVTYICGADIGLLKASEYHSTFLDTLIETWTRLFFTDQIFLVEAVEQMLVNVQLSSSLIKSLQNAATTSQSSNNPPGNPVHALIFMGTKLLSLYSTKRSNQLTSEDILFLIILCQSTRRKRDTSKGMPGENQCSSGARTSTSTSKSKPQHQHDGSSTRRIFRTKPEDAKPSSSDSLDSSDYDMQDKDNYIDETSPSPDPMRHFCILLKHGVSLLCHRVHVQLLYHGLYFVIVCETNNSPLLTQVTTGLQLAYQFNDSRRESLSKDKQYYEQFESITKKILDLLKKQKSLTIRNDLSICWDKFKAKFNQYLKTKDVIHIQISPLIDVYSKLFRTYFSKKECLKGVILNDLDLITNKVQSDLEDFLQFLQVKLSKNCTLEPKDVSPINKYLEEFPGLVHFIYIDRIRHSVTLPTLEFGQDETISLTKEKIWLMVKFSREHLQQGHFTVLWKDNAFAYSYFLWFEDAAGQPVAINTVPELPWDDFPLLPGILCGDFYKRLLAEAFPGPMSSKIKCVELFCVHLGLVTSSCVLGHSKRLASTICEVTGGSTPALIL